ncbi:hypothetical protein EDB92DRAFT_2116966 [Lactarius akahatsu]|uniref:Uncharacterized protein n=1 Tax=Lactarius akahatsu TaxID=416441 RepID=A0AAD4L9T2_9AGAM|nr:hypothetical protein EDB92DRAFT_2116966 [Lactarius akahatsu]
MHDIPNLTSEVVIRHRSTIHLFRVPHIPHTHTGIPTDLHTLSSGSEFYTAKQLYACSPTVYLTCPGDARARGDTVVGLLKLVKLNYEYRLILNERISFGTIGRTGRGTMFRFVLSHPRDFVRFSAAVPPPPAVSASECINTLRNTPPILSMLQENARAIRVVLKPVEAITIAAHASAPIIHIHWRSATTTSLSAEPPNSVTPALGEAPRFDTVNEERLLLLRGQELFDAQPSIRFAVTATLSRKECLSVAGVIKTVIPKVLAKCKRVPLLPPRADPERSHRTLYFLPSFIL